MNKITAKHIVKTAVIEAIAYCGTQAALADKAEITQGAVGKYIRGDSIPTGVTARKLSKAVDSTIPASRFAPLIFEDAA